MLYIIIGAIAYGAIYYFLFYPSTSLRAGKNVTQNSQNQTADWKTYINPTGNFEIKYPDNLYFMEPNITLGVNALSFYYKKDYKEGPLSISVVKNSDVNIDETRVVGERNVGGIDGKTIAIFTGDVYSHCERTYINKEDMVFIFDDNCGQNKDLFLQMLSTFKFTK